MCVRFGHSLTTWLEFDAASARRQRNARPGNGSHYLEDFSAGRGRPPGELSWTHVRPASRSRWRRAPGEEPLWLDGGDSFARANLVHGVGNAGAGAHPAV